MEQFENRNGPRPAVPAAAAPRGDGAAAAPGAQAAPERAAAAPPEGDAVATPSAGAVPSASAPSASASSASSPPVSPPPAAAPVTPVPAGADEPSALPASPPQATGEGPQTAAIAAAEALPPAAEPAAGSPAKERPATDRPAPDGPGAAAPAAAAAAVAAPAKARPRRRNHLLRLVLWCLAVLAGVPAAILVVWMLVGPVRLGMLEREINSVLATLAGREGSAGVGQVEVGFSLAHGLVVYGGDIHFSGPVGTATVSRAVFDVDASAFLTGAGLRIHSIAIEGVDLKLAPLPPAQMSNPEPVALLEMLNERLGRFSTLAFDRGLELATIVDGSITVPRDQPAVPPLVLQHVAVTVGTAAGGMVRGVMRATAGGQEWQAGFSRLPLAGGGTEVKIDASGISLATAFGLDFIAPGLTLSPHVDSRFDAAGRAVAASARLGAGTGAIKLGEDGTVLQRAEISLAWRPQAGDIAISPSPILFGASEIVLAGTVTAPKPGGTQWRFDLTLPRARIAPVDIPGQPVVLDSTAIDGTFDPTTRRFTLERVEAIAGSQQASLQAAFDFGPNGPRGAIDGKMTNVDYSTFIRLWPSFSATPGRKWVIGNILAGFIPNATMKLRMTPLDFDTDPTTVSPDAVPAEFRVDFTGAAMKLPPAMPDATNGAGQLVMQDNHIVVTVGSAALQAALGAPIAGSAIRVVTSDLRSRAIDITVDGTLTGEARALAALADDKPINAMKPLGITPSAISGQAKVDFHVAGPVRDTIDEKLVRWKIQAMLTGVSSAVPIRDHTISNANVTVTADNAQMTLTGKATIDGFTADVSISQATGPNAPPGKAGITLQVSEADLKAKGLDFGGLIGGTVGVTMSESATGLKQVSLDLTAARLTIPGIGWTKAAGAAAAATFDMDQKDTLFTIRNLAVTADGVSITGGLTLDARTGLQDATFSRFALRPGDNLKVRITRNGAGYAIAITGDSYDGRGLIQQLKKSSGDKAGAAAAGPPISLSARIGRLIGFGNVSLSNMEMKAALAGSRMTQLNASGQTGQGGGGVTVTLQAANGGGTALNASAGDTGRLLRFLDVYPRMEGGQGTLKAAIAKSGASQGTVQVTQFSINQDPALTGLVSTAATQVSRKTGARVQPPPDAGSAFRSLDIAFSMKGDVLTLSDIVLRGESSGGTASGTLNLASQRIALTGTFIPIFAVNNLVTKIPVIGQILGGGPDGGLIGVTFRLDGPVSAPALTYNPISGVTPGILRRIFEYK